MDSVGLADTIADLTPRWFTGVLRDGGVIGPDEAVLGAEAQLFGTGQFGLVVRAELEYGNEVTQAPRSVIVKLPSSDPGSRGLAVSIGAYEAEVRFYREIAPRSTIRVPDLYSSGFDSGSGRVTLVLEDLSVDWQAGDAIAGGTVAQSAAAIDQIARLHGELWDHPTLRTLEWLSPVERTQALFDPVPCALPTFKQRFAERLDSKHMALIERLAPRAAEYPNLAWRGPMVVTHGDFRLDNLLFSDADSSLVATVIDWQAVRLAPPLIDLCIWMTSAWTAEQRRIHQESLIRRYHDGLLAAGASDFDFEQCLASLRVCSLYVLLLGVGTSVALQQSERGDAMFAAMISSAAELVTDLGAAEIFDEGNN
ncbi:phosphotransferase family protein [Mycolicibacterium porcinum]|uniref:phosphotransferase family protein n=1 Tax=Mycolicibacterium porcinum TaxID=39693 RepID=UPI0016462E65|nr:aminoglycoside phosphotransferase family protein [Mycolicibacterium porcinum]